MVRDELTTLAGTLGVALALNTGGAGTYLLGNQIDLGAVPSPNVGGAASARDIGDGEPLFLVLSVDTTATSGGAATATFTLASDAQAAIATDGSATVHFVTAAIPVATLVAGYVIARIRIPAATPNYERYLGLLQTTATAAFTAGKIHAFLTHDAGKFRAYPDAI
jgi:hypothetical protein